MSKLKLKQTIDYLGLARLFPFMAWFKVITPRTLRFDLVAAFSSAIFALPQCIAFALIAGLPPEMGLYAGIIAPIIAGFFGSSWHSVSGPTVATSIVIISILQEYAVPESPQYIGLVLSLTLLAGIIQLLLGIFRLGHLVSFISQTVIMGFTAGAAILIISNQVANILGLSIERQKNIFLLYRAIYDNLDSVNYAILIVALSTLLICFLCQRFWPKLPAFLVAMFSVSIGVYIFSFFGDTSHIEMVGALNAGLPNIVMPDFNYHTVSQFMSSAIALATLGLIQTVSISKAIANKTGQHINSNQEFIGQGMTNIACSMTMGFFSSNSFTRTGVSYTAGSKTPMASVFASVLIVLVLLFAYRSTEFLPGATMSAIIILVGWKLIDFKHVKNIIKTSRGEFAIFLTTMVATLFLNLEFAIYSGVILALILYLQKTADPKVAELVTDSTDAYHRLIEVTDADDDEECRYLKIIRIDGSIFFGSIEHIQNHIQSMLHPQQKYLLIICDGVSVIDISAAEMFLTLKKTLQKRGGDLYLSNLKQEARAYLVNSPYWARLGSSKNVFNFSEEAVQTLFNRIDHEQCPSCGKLSFYKPN